MHVRVNNLHTIQLWASNYLNDKLDACMYFIKIKTIFCKRTGIQRSKKNCYNLENQHKSAQVVHRVEQADRDIKIDTVNTVHTLHMQEIARLQLCDE